jgi:hydroxylamine reductase (hybrid-cluster protein)
MMQIRKKTLDKATESAISQAAAAGIPLAFDRYEDMVPVCRFGQMGLDCKACTQGPCRINPFDPSNGTACGRDREGIVAAGFLGLVADGAVVNSSYAGNQGAAAPAIFEAISAANEGMLGAAQLLEKAIDVAESGFASLASSRHAVAGVRTIEVGIGALKPDMINILMVGNLPAARAEEIAAALSSDARVNMVGATGGEVAGINVAGNYNSQEALLVTTGVDGVVAGRACVAPGFLSLAAKQGVPVVDADHFDPAALMDKADAHCRMHGGRNLAAKFPPASATVGFGTAAFSSISPAGWAQLAGSGVRGVALLGGCNNAATTQDAVVVRQAAEFLANDVLVIANGCAAVALAKAGYMDPSRVASFAGKGLQSFLHTLSDMAKVALPAVLEAGSCWQMPAALEMAQLFQKGLKLPLAAAMPELSRPASWCSALAIASQGVPTYVGPILPLDGGLETVGALNEMLKGKGGALVGPGQIGDPEAVVSLIFGASS